MTKKADQSEAARELGKLGAKKGGKARASVLTAEERSEIARAAAAKRWEKAGKPPKTPKLAAKKTGVAASTDLPFSQLHGTLQMGNVELSCHVLNDGRRVLSQTEFVRVLSGGRKRGSLRPYLHSHPLVEEDAFAGRTIEFRIPGNPQTAIGYEATLLVELCDLYMEADILGRLRPSQESLAIQAAVVVRACAKVGIIALIDEATGYQKVRAARALQIKLQAYIADDMQEWARLFPEEFFVELARLEGIHYSARHRPLRWGQYILHFVYRAVDEDVTDELKARTPQPHFKENLHQWLTGPGRTHVHDHIQRVIAVMKLCDSMPEFKHRFDKAFKRDYQADLFDWDVGV